MSLNESDNIKAAELIRELRGWAKINQATGMADCMVESAEILEKFIQERRELEAYISEREWLHREG